MTLLFTDRRAMLRGFILCAAAAFGAASHAAETQVTLPQLMQTLAQVKAGEATFVERRTVQMLERTLESSGKLWFAAPDTFVRETLKPRRESVKVVGNNVTMSQGSRSRTVALDSVPEANVILEAICGTLTGNGEALELHFKTGVAGTAERWSLELVPRDVLLREQVLSVRVSGVQALVREVLVVMADGDRSVMTIAPLVATTAPASPPR